MKSGAKADRDGVLREWSFTECQVAVAGLALVAVSLDNDSPFVPAPGDDVDWLVTVGSVFRGSPRCNFFGTYENVLASA